MLVFINDGRRQWRWRWDGTNGTALIVLIDGGGKETIAETDINRHCSLQWSPLLPLMKNDIQWVLLVVVVNFAAELMVIINGSDSGRCQWRQQGARVAWVRADEGPRARERG